MEISYRFLDIDSEDEISQWLDLFSLCFQQKITHNYWQNLYLENPFYKKIKPLIFIAETGGKIIGSLSLTPSPLVERWRDFVIPVNSLLLCKAMVHPDFQNQKIFGNLLINALKTAETEEYDLVVTISDNLYSYRAFINIGFHYVAEMRWSSFFLSTDVFSKYINRIPLPGRAKKFIISSFSWCYSRQMHHHDHPYQIKKGDIPEFISEIEKITALSPHNAGIFGVRTADFLFWKFIREDACFKVFSIWKNGTMLCYTIIQLKEETKNAYIVDCFFLKDQQSLLSILISEINSYLKENNFKVLSAYLVENNTSFTNFFSLRNGFFKRSSKAGKLKKSRLLVYPINNKISHTPLLNRNTWNLQPVDTCLFLE